MSDQREPEEPSTEGAKLPEPTFETVPAVAKKKAGEPVGGFAFFLSLSVLLPTGIFLTGLTLVNVRPVDVQALGTFGASWIAGMMLGHVLIKGHISVLIHESKHAVVSNFAGNKRKEMKVNKDSGHFVYSYTKHTAHFNALISLAPYILPVFTVVGLIASLAIFRNDHVLAALLVGMCYGIDTILNARDISPIQPDIHEIRGGFGIGLLYIFSWNLTIFALLLAWAFQGGSGILMLLEQTTAALMRIYLLVSTGTFAT